MLLVDSKHYDSNNHRQFRSETGKAEVPNLRETLSRGTSHYSKTITYPIFLTCAFKTGAKSAFTRITFYQRGLKNLHLCRGIATS